MQRVANDQLRLRIDAGGGLVENQDTRVERQRAGERQQLFLPDRQRRAALRDCALVPFRQSQNERLGVHRARSPLQPLIVNRRVSKADVVRNRAREQMHILQDEAEQPAQLGEIELANVDAVHQNPAAPHVVEPEQQVDERRLSRPGRADDADTLARPHLEAHVL